MASAAPTSSVYRLAVVVENTYTQRASWPPNREATERYLKVLEHQLKRHPEYNYQLALVLYGSDESSGSVCSTSWTSDVGEFRQWADGIRFEGGGEKTVSGSALASALAEVIYLSKCPYPGGSLPPHSGDAPLTQMHTHILLVPSLTQPSRLPIPWGCHEETTLARVGSSFYHAANEKIVQVTQVTQQQVPFFWPIEKAPLPGSATCADLVLSLTNYGISFTILYHGCMNPYALALFFQAHHLQPTALADKKNYQRSITRSGACVLVSPLAGIMYRGVHQVSQAMLAQHRHAMQQQAAAAAAAAAVAGRHAPVGVSPSGPATVDIARGSSGALGRAGMGTPAGAAASAPGIATGVPGAAPAAAPATAGPMGVPGPQASQASTAGGQRMAMPGLPRQQQQQQAMQQNLQAGAEGRPGVAAPPIPQPLSIPSPAGSTTHPALSPFNIMSPGAGVAASSQPSGGAMNVPQATQYPQQSHQQQKQQHVAPPQQLPTMPQQQQQQQPYTHSFQQQHQHPQLPIQQPVQPPAHQQQQQQQPNQFQQQYNAQQLQHQQGRVGQGVAPAVGMYGGPAAQQHQQLQQQPGTLPQPPQAASTPAPGSAAAPAQQGSMFWQGTLYYQAQSNMVPVADVQLTSAKANIVNLPMWSTLKYVVMTQMLSKDQMAAHLVKAKKSNMYMLVPVNYKVVRALQGLEMVRAEVEKKPEKQIALLAPELDHGREAIFVFGMPFQLNKANGQMPQELQYDINSNYMIAVLGTHTLQQHQTGASRVPGQV